MGASFYMVPPIFMYTLEQMKEYVKKVKDAEEDVYWYRPTMADLMLRQLIEGMDEKEEHRSKRQD